MNKTPSFHGWLILDKPQGMTSFQAISRAKRLLGVKKAGHAGTLDPMASGVLPVAFGEATKTISLMMDTEKAYEFTISFGHETDTDDAEGTITQSSTVFPTKSALENALTQFVGTIQQVPPAYSAIHVNGKRAYVLAREGKEVILPPRTVTIHSLELLDMPDHATAHCRMYCGKGTYVRSVARDVARVLGGCAHVSRLRRIKVGRFAENQSIFLEKLEELVHSARPFEGCGVLQPVEAVLDDIPVLHLDEPSALRLRHGQTVSINDNRQSDRIAVCCQDKLVAIGHVEHHRLKPLRVFNH